jgi:hypothetical protein
MDNMGVKIMIINIKRTNGAKVMKNIKRNIKR